MREILQVLVAFVLTGLVGNSLLQKWQHRTWLRQQKFLGHEKEYIALKDLADELSKAMGARLYYMKRLLSALRSLPNEELLTRLNEYDSTLKFWNENLSSYYVRLTFYAEYYRATDLEREIHRPFAGIGSEIEKIVRLRKTGAVVPASKLRSLEHDVNSLQGAIFRYNRDMLRVVEDVRKRIYFGVSVPYNADHLNEYSSVELIKALFIRDVNGHTVIRPASDPRFPGNAAV